MINLQKIPVHEVHGIGEQKAEELKKMDIFSVAQLLDYFPFRYEDYRIRDLAEVQEGEKVTIQGTVYGQALVQMYGRKKSRLTCKILVNQVLVTAVWFNRHFLKDKLSTGREVIVTGKWEQRRRQITVSESEFPGSARAQTGQLQPVYSLPGTIKQQGFRKIMKQALTQFGENIAEILPRFIIEKYGFPSRKKAVQRIHQPEQDEEALEARKRMIYEELFLFQVKMHAFRALIRKRADGVEHEINLPLVREFVRSLPFRLTTSQKKVIADILHDLQQPYSMNRLLQGDVGSGKTIVAAVALFATAKSGHQGAFMVPTEILAEQHKRSLDNLFAPYGIQVELLSGSLTNKQRKDRLAALQMGLIDVLVGTHALIQEDVFFRQLGLVVTDEQHRFGVKQRSILRRKGMNPDALTMTATPIPRTLAISAFGDMDVSTLREMPKGRKPIKTYAVKHDMLHRVIAFIHKEVTNGRQAYVVCPLIEESDKLDVQNAIDVHAQLQHALPDLSIELLHGRLPQQEKDQIMRNFSDNHIQVLVATTVIEVGVDVANATLMIVYDAERFGLSQLHQLRGRVGRGEHQSHCILIADPKNEIAKERMKVMTQTNDGFEIARRDLELRGPGDFFGTKQSGLPEFRLADMVRDFELLEMARDDAAELVARSDFWTAAAYLPLREYLLREQVMDSEMLD